MQHILMYDNQQICNMLQPGIILFHKNELKWIVLSHYYDKQNKKIYVIYFSFKHNKILKNAFLDMKSLIKGVISLYSVYDVYDYKGNSCI